MCHMFDKSEDVHNRPLPQHLHVKLVLYDKMKKKKKSKGNFWQSLKEYRRVEMDTKFDTFC